MIEFKGAYFKKGQCTPQSVLVQFDGVLLHVWHMSEPFHRLLTSDVFRLPSSMGRRKQHIKLPNGGRIVTDDTGALDQLQGKTSSAFTVQGKYGAYSKFIVGGAALLLLTGVIFIARHILIP